jgi:uncharacterized protein (TIGR03118 family)
MYARRLLTVGIAVATAVGITLPAGVSAGSAKGAFLETNLVSNGAVPAQIVDPQLKNPWGLSASSGSPMWVSDNNAGVSTLYNLTANPVQKQGLTVTIPPGKKSPPGSMGSPTGTVFNPTNDFQITKGGTTGKAVFIFATEDGAIAAWKGDADSTNAVLPVDNSAPGDVGAVYKGLAMGSIGSANFLYAANFRFGTVDVFDGSFKPAGSFTDPKIPAGYAPFGIQVLGKVLYVTYAMQNAVKHDDVAGQGHGFVDAFDLSGNLIDRLVSHGQLDSPWGIAIAPASFGDFAGDLLVGNFGNGRINAYTLDKGNFRGQLESGSGPIVLDGLWGLRVGNGGAGGDASKIYFSAGINGENDGLVGSIEKAG